jgi:hypothetical protein
VNAWDEPKQTLEGYFKKGKFKHTLLLNGGTTFNEYKLQFVPSTFWIDATGNVVSAELGFDGPRDLDRRTRALVGS